MKETKAVSGTCVFCQEKNDIIQVDGIYHKRTQGKFLNALKLLPQEKNNF